MKRMSWTVAAVVILFLIIGGYYYFNGLTSYGAEKSGTNPALNVASSNTSTTNTVTTNTTSIATTTTTTATSKSYNVDISNYAFVPVSITINKGDIVVWTNKDYVSHSVVSDSGSELKSSLLKDAESYSHTFNSIRTFSYHCGLHSSMKATIIVV